MDRNSYVSFLLSFYGPLLTERQYTALDCHYNNDLSLGEIAQQQNSSRQAVSDAINKGIAALEAYEEKLGCVKKYREMNKIITELKELSNMCGAETSARINEELERIADIWEE